MDFFMYARMIYVVRTNEKCIVFGLFLDFSIPPQSWGLRNTILFFRGPMLMRLKNSGSFWVGQVPRTSRVLTKTEEACERCICLSLSRPFAAGPASSLFVVGCRRCPSCDTYQVPGYSYLLLDHAVPFSPPFFSRLALPNKYSTIGCCCLMLLNISISLFFAFLSPPNCMREGLMVVVLDQRSGAAYYIHFP